MPSIEVPTIPDIEDEIPETPDVPEVETPDTPDVPETPEIVEETLEIIEETPEIVEETPDVPDETSDDFSVVEFDDPDVPLADTPFDDEDDTPETYSNTTNPKTGQDTTAYGVTAAAAMASFLALLYASKARREAEKNS